jgi:hypothetical protein
MSAFARSFFLRTGATAVVKAGACLHYTTLEARTVPVFLQLEPTLLYREFCVLISRVGTAFVVATPTIQ